jgi:hypothetical protein
MSYKKTWIFYVEHSERIMQRTIHTEGLVDPEQFDRFSNLFGLRLFSRFQTLFLPIEPTFYEFISRLKKKFDIF